MKTLIVSFVVTFASTASLFAHCDACSVAGKEGHAHESACTTTQLETYFSTQAGLANDNLTAAQAAAKSLIDLAAKKGCSLDGKSCCAVEVKAAQMIADAPDIAAARLAFKSWSDAVIAKMEESGISDRTVFKMHCPMAFSNKGGTWLQASKDLRNPYYGSMMLKCGMVQETYSHKLEHSEITDQPKHHNH